jgi:chemotaxis protein histidine kinase CheA
LCISKRLAVALGGDIEVASELGKGSVFTLTIDAAPLSDGVRRTAFVRRIPDNRQRPRI